MSEQEIGPISPTRLIEILNDLITAIGALTLTATVTEESPVSKASVFNTAVAAATDILDTDLTCTRSPAHFRIYVAFDTAGVFSVQRTVGVVTVAEQMNAIGAAVQALVANAAYMFDILVETGDTINFQHSVGGQLLKMIVVEV